VNIYKVNANTVKRIVKENSPNARTYVICPANELPSRMNAHTVKVSYQSGKWYVDGEEYTTWRNAYTYYNGEPSFWRFN
jgi:hypothetical protein